MIKESTIYFVLLIVLLIFGGSILLAGFGSLEHNNIKYIIGIILFTLSCCALGVIYFINMTCEIKNDNDII